MEKIITLEIRGRTLFNKYFHCSIIFMSVQFNNISRNPTVLLHSRTFYAGGEVVRAGRQISFDVIANVRKIVKAENSPNRVSYEVWIG